MWIPSGPSCWRRITLGNLNIVLVLMSSPCLKGKENTSNNADPTTSNLPENRGSQDVIRHFLGLGILTKIMKPRLVTRAVMALDPSLFAKPREHSLRRSPHHRRSVHRRQER